MALPSNLKYNYRAQWSPRDGEYVGLVDEFPSLSWLAPTPQEAVDGIAKVVASAVDDIQDAGELPPVPRVAVDNPELQALEIDLEVAHIGEILEQHHVPPTSDLVHALWEWGVSIRRP